MMISAHLDLKVIPYSTVTRSSTLVATCRVFLVRVVWINPGGHLLDRLLQRSVNVLPNLQRHDIIRKTNVNRSPGSGVPDKKYSGKMSPKSRRRMASV